MRKFTSLLAAGVVAFSALATVAYADNPMVGGAAMYADKNIVENAVNSKDHTTLVAAVQAAGLVETLQGAGPFTVFAPVNSAFDACRQARSKRCCPRTRTSWSDLTATSSLPRRCRPT